MMTDGIYALNKRTNKNIALSMLVITILGALTVWDAVGFGSIFGWDSIGFRIYVLFTSVWIFWGLRTRRLAAI